MKISRLGFCVACLVALATNSNAQFTNSLPGRVIAKMLPDYLRPRVYALNKANGSTPGTVLALNPTNGATLNEISVNLNPTDMAISPAGDTMYVIHAGSRTIARINLDTFSLVDEKTIVTPNTYSTANPLYVVAQQAGLLFYTDGAWGPGIYAFDYAAGTNKFVLDTGGNQSIGAGGMVLNRSGNLLYTWQQYGWSAGYANSSIAPFTVAADQTLTALPIGPSQSRDPLDTPIFLDAAETRVFNKLQMVAATNVSVLLSQFTENIYAISFDGSLAFGPTKVFNAGNGIALTNFTASTTVQTLSGDQKRLFRYLTSGSQLVVYDMAAVAPVSGPNITPSPADGAVVGLPPTNLLWSVSPIALAYDVYYGTNQAQVAAASQASALYLGRVTVPGKALAQPPAAGSTNYWRVDVVGFSTTNTGPTWSFIVSPLAVTPTAINVGAIAGFNPSSISITLTSAIPRAWSAAVTGANWLSLSALSGTSPATINASFTTAALAAGTYTNLIEITVGALKVPVPVTLDVKPLNITKMATDYQRPYIYALQAPANSGQNGQLLFINTSTGNIDKTLPIGINPVDLTIHYGEGRLYIASWTENSTYVVDLITQTLLPPLHLGTDVYKINAGKPGQLMIEGMDQWITGSLINTSNGTTIVSTGFREGDGEFDPTGRFYYHCDNNISGAGVGKYDLSTNTFTSVAGAGGHAYYGSRNLLMAPDGTRLFWTGAVYDANLNELAYLSDEIYATTAHGDLALSSTKVINPSNGQTLYTWPFTTTVLAVSGDQQKVFLFNTTTKLLTSIPMSAIASVPGPGLNPTPANGSVVNPPLAQVSWTASPAALSYRVFFGTNQSAVTSATTNSVLYLGNTTTTAFALPAPITPGVTYYWRVDSVGFSSVTTGTVWNFTASPVSLTPQTLSYKGVVGLPILPQAITISAPTPTAWTLSAAQSWLTLSATSGTTPANVTLNFATTNLAVGYYTNQLTLVANGITQQLPVVVQLFNLNATKMAVDPNRNMIYVLHPGSGTFDDAFVLFLNTTNGVVEKVLPIGANPTDLTVHPREDRLYVSNWQRNSTRVVDLVTRTELPALTLGTDVYKINAGLNGRIIYEQQDQWINMYLVNSATGSNITTGFVREGDGESDPSGRFYYHVDNNSSGAAIYKYDMIGDTFASVASAGKHNGYGSRNLVMSLDGSRLFWTTAMYDANLVDFGVIGGEIYGCSTNGSIAFASTVAYDTATKLVVYNLPVSTTVMAVDRLDQKLWYFNSSTAQIQSLAMATIRAPSITTQPVGVSVPINGNVNLTITAKGIAPLSYQWTMAGTNLPGATNYFLAMNGIQPSQDADYRVVVSNPFGAVTSSVAHVTVIVPPAITASPASTNVAAGQSFTLTVAASGTAPLSYRWMLEGVTIAGATTTNLTITNAQLANEGIYRVIVTNIAGAATSSVALLRILPAMPAITAQPASLTVGASSNASFSVSAQGSQPMSYQWRFNGQFIPGALAATYSLTNVQAMSAGGYTVVVSNGFGSITSAVAILTVIPTLPYFVTQPVGYTNAAGTNFTLTSLARGSEPIAYQWQQNGTNLAGVTLTSMSVTNTKLSDSGVYTVLASNIAGTFLSAAANVAITAAPPVFVEQPLTTTWLVGSSNVVNSRATGSTPLSYRWYYQSALVLNQTNRQFLVNPVTLAAAGTYFAVASNQFGMATSTVATITVNQTPLLASGLSNLVVSAGSSVLLTVSSTGSPPPTFTWQFNGLTIPGETGSSLLLTNLQPAQSGFYRLTAANANGSVSTTSRVSVLGPLGRVLAWGDNSGAQTNVPPNGNDLVAVAGGDYHSVALRSNGTLVAWGYNGDGQTTVPTSSLRFVAVAAGASHNLALAENGSVIAWGRNDFGQRTVPAAASNNVLAIAAGDAHSLALLQPGTVTGWGDNSFAQVSGGNGLTSVRAIAAGRIHSLALRNNGTVTGWGYNGYGQTSPPATLTNASAIAAGYLHSVALCSNGTVVVWGDNTYGQTNVPVSVSNAVAIAAGDFHTLARLADGSIIGWGNNDYGQTTTPNLTSNSIAIASGYYHGLALVPTPILWLTKSANKMVINWSTPGTLQWANAPTGPFFDIIGPTGCYTNNDLAAPAKFFRLRQ
ncbi:MAG: immunoglobulin domain-containing protein [Verrucomicrobiota bacterium]